MNTDKKKMIHAKQKSVAILKRNRQLLKIDILVLSIGLAFSYFGNEGIGNPILWLGVIIFVYSIASSFMVKRQLI
ncbi:hypothetical protein [Methanolobus profundi]|uniref:Uncharacterized protein n=1 Tax=Methanolobus profundi TaxID=487685 RepID=A0A1I4P690_9EURY|nr:hypothetical protein [Methanolobus profundi]SFM23282.1 hypothetical protein SAMN04488696_0473 [Methanolobus profundi]